MARPAGQARPGEDRQACPLVRGRPRIGVPVAGIGNFIAIGLNYTDHAEETGMAAPAKSRSSSPST
jgi:2,4-didehydro-3-deoxy-L-rhamnonate hydrolase